jgi:hypothetical protein
MALTRLELSITPLAMGALDTWPSGARSIPQKGHLPGLGERTWGCIEQV